MSDVPELFVCEVADGAGGVNLVFVFWANVMVEEVVEEVSDNGSIGFELTLLANVERIGEA